MSRKKSAALAVQEPTETALAHIDEPQYVRVSQDHKLVARIWKLHTGGLTQAKIAQELSCHQSTISRILDDFEDDTTDLAQRDAKRNALKRRRYADDILEKTKDKDPEVALKVIKHEDAISGLGVEDKGLSVGIQVVLGTEGNPAGRDPFRGQTITVQSNHNGPLSDAKE